MLEGKCELNLQEIEWPVLHDSRGAKLAWHREASRKSGDCHQVN